MRHVVVIGSGKRVVDAALPAFARVKDRFELEGIYARSVKTIEVEGRPQPVRTLSTLDNATLDRVDLIYMAVGKPNVGAVLQELGRFDLSRIDLLLETPVLLLKHFHHVKHLTRFRNVWVSEDCIALPWFDTVRLAEPALGIPRSVEWRQSAYAYHGVAMSKTLLNSGAIRSGVRRQGDPGTWQRHLTFANGAKATIVEPRDYSLGSFTLTGARGSISDRRSEVPTRLLLAPILAQGNVAGFRAGDFETRLDESEARLACGGDPSTGVIARMEAMKRVGFLRLLRRIDAGTGAYPLEEGLDDMVIDSALQKLGRWFSSPLTSPKSAMGSALLRAVSRISGG